MRILYSYTLLLIVAVVAPVAGHAADQEEKPVHLIWFPRFSPDGKWLISAHGNWNQDEGGEVRVWDAESGQPKFVIPTERGVRTVAWAPKDKAFVAGDYGGTVHFYNSDTGKQTGQLKLPGNVEVLQISADGKRLIAAIGNGSVRVWELPSQKEVHTWKQIHLGGIWGMALSPDGKTLATGGKDRIARVYDMQTFTVLHEIEHPNEINGIVFTSDNKHVLTGCGDSIIRVYDVAEGALQRQLGGHERGSVTDLQFSSDGKLLASSGMDQTVRLWDMSDFDRPVLKATVNAHDSLVFGVAISPDAKWLASAGWDEQIKMWKVATQKELWSKSR